jgi:hypothetical protein
MTAATTPAHPSSGLLLDYWLRDTDRATTDMIDEHLMRCDACGEALDALIALGAGVRAAFRAGAFAGMASDAFVQRLIGRGVRIREYRVPRNGSVNCTVAPDDELLVAHLAAPLRGVRRLDALVRLSLQGDVQHRLSDVAFDPQADEVVWLPKTDEVKRLPEHTAEVTLVSMEPGGPRELGRYAFRHRPWPGW